MGPGSVPRAVRVGGTSKADLREALRADHVQLNPAAEALFEDQRFATLPRCREIEIVARSVADLGFKSGATYGELTARAHESGWVECPLELGPHLRIQFVDQLEAPRGIGATTHRAPPGSITVASPPLDGRDETAKGFYLMHADGALWLRGYWSWPGHVWEPEDVFVFCDANSTA